MEPVTVAPSDYPDILTPEAIWAIRTYVETRPDDQQLAENVDTIRSLREFRYKDENALWLGGEYKWRPKRFLSVMLFADAGKVSPNWRGLGVNDMRAGYGAGVGFHTSRQTITRIDVGTGSGEGWQVFIKFRPSF